MAIPIFVTVWMILKILKGCNENAYYSITPRLISSFSFRDSNIVLNVFSLAKLEEAKGY